MTDSTLNLADYRRELLTGSFGYYARNCLYINTKTVGLIPFKMNKEQCFLDAVIEQQKRETGRVRVIIIKGRQQGISTYIQGRIFRLVTTQYGKRAFILKHESQATENIFGMTQRYLAHAPDFVKPVVGKCNQRNIHFENIDSGYGVGTARNENVGRSQTIHYFHGSEVAYWTNGEAHLAGLLQAVPDEPGTEIYLESTANGLNFFHQQFVKAQKEKSDFIVVFIPWFWNEGYRTKPPADFELTNDEAVYAEQHGLDGEQMYWRRKRIIGLSNSVDMSDGELLFKQEYPATAAEAFQYTGGDTLITPEMCMAARKREVTGFGKLIVGIDPSYGGDRFAIVRRQGQKIYGNEAHQGPQLNDFMYRVNLCKNILDTVDPVAGKKPDYVIFDSGAGRDVASKLASDGYTNIRVVDFGSKANDQKNYRNRRQEMYANLVLALIDPDFPVQIPDDDEFQADLCATPYKYNPLTEAKELLAKAAIIKEFGRSPDLADAAALTFAVPLHSGTSTPVRRPRPNPILSER